MAKKTDVLICDICNSKVAITKCDICKKDLCKTCAKNIVSVFDKNDWKTELLDLEVCINCKKRTSKLLTKNFEEGKLHRDSIIGIMNKTFVDLIKSKGMLNEIEDDED